jgi:hypothetical protein
LYIQKKSDFFWDESKEVLEFPNTKTLLSQHCVRWYLPKLSNEAHSSQEREREGDMKRLRESSASLFYTQPASPYNQLLINDPPDEPARKRYRQQGPSGGVVNTIANTTQQALSLTSAWSKYLTRMTSSLLPFGSSGQASTAQHHLIERIPSIDYSQLNNSDLSGSQWTPPSYYQSPEYVDDLRQSESQSSSLKGYAKLKVNTGPTTCQQQSAKSLLIKTYATPVSAKPSLPGIDLYSDEPDASSYSDDLTLTPDVFGLRVGPRLRTGRRSARDLTPTKSLRHLLDKELKNIPDCNYMQLRQNGHLKPSRRKGM